MDSVAAANDQTVSDQHHRFLAWPDQGVNAIEAILDGKGDDDRQLAHVFQRSLIVGFGHDPVDTLLQRLDDENITVNRTVELGEGGLIGV